MRRTILTALAILAAVSAAPTAAASSTALRIDFPSGTFPGDATVPVNVTIYVNDFMCHAPRDFVVFLSANTTEGVKATFAKTNLTFTTPARAYFGEPFSETQSVNLTVRALQSGQAELTAWMEPGEAGACFAPDGFQPSRTTVLVQVDAAASPPTTPPPAANETATNETATNQTDTNTTPSRATPTASGGPAVCPPNEVCGPIGDYAAPQESANDTPGLGMIGALAAVALGAFLLKRRKT